MRVWGTTAGLPGGILWTLTFVLAALLGGGASGAEPVDAEPAGALSIESVEHRETALGETKVFVVGEARLPDGAVLHVSFNLGPATGAWTRATVAGGRFETFIVSIGKKILPATYVIRVEMREQDQSPAVLDGITDWDALVPVEAPLAFGDTAAAETAREDVRRQLILVADELGQAYGSLGQFGSFYLDKVKMLRIKHFKGIPEDETRRILDGWTRYADQNWEPMRSAIRHDWDTFRSEVYLTPFPAAEDLIESGFARIKTWFGATVHEIYNDLSVPPPPDVDPPGPLSWVALQRQIVDLSGELYRALGEGGRTWVLIDLGIPEDGMVEGDTYTSYVAKFRVSRPEDHWQFDPAGFDPRVRVRVRPTKEAEQKRAVAGVEIKDYALAEDFKDLERQLIISIQARWPGFKKLAARSLAVKDATMPNGTRLGYECVFQTVQGGVVFVVREYELFCRWHKRTYGVICISPEGDYEAFKRPYGAICRSLEVLDDPKYEPLEEEERNRR